VTTAEDPALRLARRLRSLRKECWPGKRITQGQLSQAFDVSEPLISSWERSTDPALPPLYRLEAYATFFATVRSVEKRPFRLIAQLTGDEQLIRDTLLTELTELRDQAQGKAQVDAAPQSADNLWRFPPNEDITIVCSELPEGRRAKLPSTDPDDPDYVKLYHYSDLDSLLELHGHIRAMNPTSTVDVSLGTVPLRADGYTSHLVLLGGVDWNKVTEEVLHRIDLPMRQLERPEDTDTGGFEIIENGVVVETFRPVLREIGDRQVLAEDVAHFYRSRNPFNRQRTVTICNGMYARGVLGAVRALTDVRFRDRNNAHARSRLDEHDTFSILSRVQVLLEGEVVTPDWTDPDHLLHEWFV
jgi:hypothetical protein